MGPQHIEQTLLHLDDTGSTYFLRILTFTAFDAFFLWLGQEKIFTHLHHVNLKKWNKRSDIILPLVCRKLCQLPGPILKSPTKNEGLITRLYEIVLRWIGPFTFRLILLRYSTIFLSREANRKVDFKDQVRHISSEYMEASSPRKGPQNTWLGYGFQTPDNQTKGHTDICNKYVYSDHVKAFSQDGKSVSVSAVSITHTTLPCHDPANRLVREKG